MTQDELNNHTKLYVRIGKNTSKIDIVNENRVWKLFGTLEKVGGTSIYHNEIGPTLEQKMKENEEGKIIVDYKDLLDNTNEIRELKGL